MAFLTATIRGDRRVIQLMEEMKDKTRTVAVVWPQVGDVVAENMAEQFATEGVHLTGRHWAPLKPAYLAWKVRHGFHPEILRRTDAMAASLISRPMAVEEYRPFSATFGTDDPKAHFHQGGTRFMAERRIMDVDHNPEFADDVMSVIAKYIFEKRL